MKTGVSSGGVDEEQRSRLMSAKTRPVRPSSARRAPPKPKKNDFASEEPVSGSVAAANLNFTSEPQGPKFWVEGQEWGSGFCERATNPLLGWASGGALEAPPVEFGAELQQQVYAFWTH